MELFYENNKLRNFKKQYKLKNLKVKVKVLIVFQITNTT